MKRFLLVVSVLPALALTTGCESIEGLELDDFIPDVRFKQLAVDDVNWEGADTRFIFEVDNPNPVDIDLARFDYALAFQGIEFLTGDSPDGLTLQAADASELALPVSLEFLSLYEMAQAIRGEDDIGFKLDGSFGFDTDLGPIDLPYVEEGGFPAPRRPDITYRRLRVEDLSFTGADLALKLDVDNDHGSNLFFRNLDYQMTLAGFDIGGGYIEEFGEVDGASTQVLSIPIAVDFLDVGTALYDLLTEREIQVQVDAVMDVDTPFGLVPLDFNRTGRVSLER